MEYCLGCCVGCCVGYRVDCSSVVRTKLNRLHEIHSTEVMGHVVAALSLTY